MILRWLDAALDDLRAIKVYIAEENPDAARRVVASHVGWVSGFIA